MATKYSADVTDANNLADRINYIKTMADEIVVAETKTSGMQADSRLVEAFADSAEVKVRTVDFSDQPLEDMGVNGTYPVGQIKMTWQTLTLTNYKGKAFDVGHIQSEKSGFPDEATYDVTEFTRQVIVPTLDKHRLSKLTEYAGTTETGAALTTANVLTAIKNGVEVIADSFNVDSGLTIYVPNSTAALLDLSTEIGNYRDVADAGRVIATRVNTIDGNTLIRVPNSYLSGYAFAIHAPNTIQAVTELAIKHVGNENNTRGHGDFIGFDVYYDTFAMLNKKAGIYAYKVGASE